MLMTSVTERASQSSFNWNVRKGANAISSNIKRQWGRLNYQGGTKGMEEVGSTCGGRREFILKIREKQ